ncbi:TPA: hypothetical protein N0F65_007546 [Lagenidium giganteum]|uniref:Uncharacterized protein n=1 Tax=Lagenidium giganteum TaxID=4803 RepID=A0AAV2ZN58_9STRA|nr:TPA: hypothetical protein N0F65_007546 [Lagenidium giganteum]
MAPSTTSDRINVLGAPTHRMDAPTNNFMIGTKSLLHSPTALLNKNTVATDNNVFITKSNILFSQNDRLALARKVEAYVANNMHEDAATLSKNTLRAITAPDTDSILMNKASTVVAGFKAGDQTTMGSRMMDLVNAAYEQAMQAQLPQGNVAFIGTKDILRQPSGVVNKNFVMSDNQVSITRSQLSPSSHDQVTMSGGAKVADVIVPGSSILVNPKMTTSDRINVLGAPTHRMDAPTNNFMIGTKSLLHSPTALLNKNTVATDNNVFITKSNILFSQNDRLALARKVEAYVANNMHEDAATLSKNTLRAITAPDTDSILMNKASTVVAGFKAGDQTTMGSRMMDLVNAAYEQAMQAQLPQGNVAFIGTKDILRQPSGVVNKNFVMSDNQVSITRSQLSPSSHDQVTMSGGAKVADVIVPGSSILVNPKMT